MAETLPRGWIRVRLGDVCIPVETANPADRPSAEFTYIDIGAIDNKANKIVDTKVVTGRNAPSRARQVVQGGDILVATVRTYLRNIARVEEEYQNSIASTGFAVVRPADGVLTDFIFFQILSDTFMESLNELQSGSSYPAVRAKDVFDQQILLAPTAEQELIAAKLSESFTAIGRAEIASRRAIERIQRYRSAVLDAALTGELTRSWRNDQQSGSNRLVRGEAVLADLLNKRRASLATGKGKRGTKSGRSDSGNREPASPEVEGMPSLPLEWVWASADQLTEAARPITYGIIKLGPDVPEGVPVLRSSDVRHLELDLTGVKRVSRKIADQYHRTYLKGGEVVVTVRGTLGGVVAVPSDCAGYNVSREVAVLSVVDQSISQLIAYFIAAPLLQQWILDRTRGIAYTGINIGSLRVLPLPIPSREEQQMIVQQVSERLSSSNRLRDVLKTQLERVATTKQSLLNDAFSGRFVTQDLTSESASEIVWRVQKGQQAVGRRSKGKKRMPITKPIRPTDGRRDLLDVLTQHRAPMSPEELFKESGHTQDTIEEFFAELRALTASPARIIEDRGSDGSSKLRVSS